MCLTGFLWCFYIVVVPVLHTGGVLQKKESHSVSIYSTEYSNVDELFLHLAKMLLKKKFEYYYEMQHADVN